MHEQAKLSPNRKYFGNTQEQRWKAGLADNTADPCTPEKPESALAVLRLHPKEEDACNGATD